MAESQKSLAEIIAAVKSTSGAGTVAQIEDQPKRGRPKKTRGKERRYKGVMVDFAPDMVAALDAAAVAEGLDSRSELVRRVCASYLRRAGKRLGDRMGEPVAL